MDVCAITPRSAFTPFLLRVLPVLAHINSRSKAQFLPWASQKLTCTQALVSLVTLLKMEGLEEESHHRLGRLWFVFTLKWFICHDMIFTLIV